jgi:hypothetical protein
VLDAPGCMPYREVEEFVPEATAAPVGSRVDRRVTARPLHIGPDCAAGVVHGTKADLSRINSAVPLDLSAVRKRKWISIRVVVVGA